MGEAGRGGPRVCKSHGSGTGLGARPFADRASGARAHADGKRCSPAGHSGSCTCIPLAKCALLCSSRRPLAGCAEPDCKCVAAATVRDQELCDQTQQPSSACTSHMLCHPCLQSGRAQRQCGDATARGGGPAPGGNQPQRPLAELVQRWLLARANVWALQQRRPPWTPPSIGTVPNRVSGLGPEGDLSSA